MTDDTPGAGAVPTDVDAAPEVAPGPRPDPAPASAPLPRPAGRLPQLDGVRGAASVVVMIHHAFLVMPWATAGYFAPREELDGPARLMTYSPLHLVWAGSEAVLLFFVLSGAVLVHPLLDPARPARWRTYYPSRLVRLYVPVAAAVALAVVVVLVVPRHAAPGASEWVARHDVPLTPTGIARDLVLLRGTGWTNSALWSLRWEVVFSLLLPLYVLVVRRPRLATASVVPYVALLLVAGARAPSSAVFYLLVFAAGSLLALLVVRAPARETGTVTGWLLTTVAVLALTWRWWPRSLGLDDVTRYWPVAAVVGSAAVLLLVVRWPPARRVFSSRALVRCGTISFSLYLVHEPVVVSAAILVPTGLSWLAAIVGVVVAVPLAVVFHRLVEVPAHRLAQRIRGGSARA